MKLGNSKHIVYMLLSVGIGGVAGGIISYVSKRELGTRSSEEIERLNTDWSEDHDMLMSRIEKKNEMIDMTIAEISELREACRIILDAGQYETILEQVKYKMRDANKKDPELRQSIEDCVDIYKQINLIAQKEVDENRASELSESLGYYYAKDSLRAGEAIAQGLLDGIEEGKRLYGKEKRKVMRIEPDDDGSEEFGPDYVEPDDDDDTWTTDTQTHVSGDDIVRDEPYIISEWQFTYGKQHYSKVSLEYLCLDDTVLDEDESQLDQAHIGPENLRAFETDDCDSIFIRNDKLEIDYEIMWTEASFTHDVLGYPESEVSGRRIWRSWENREE